MKTKVLYIAVILTLAGIVSCSKDRTDDKSNEYEALDDFYELNAPEEQEFIIDSLGGDTITGNQGTKIWGIPKTIFMVKATQQDINYPYTLKLIEAYSIKDMILSKLPNLAQEDILKTGGELKITAFKNNDELALKQNCSLPYLAPNDAPDASMDVYYGFTDGTVNDWNVDVTQTDYLFATDAVTSLSISGNNYLVNIAKLGYTSPADVFPITSGSDITFTADGTNTHLIDVYVVFNNLHSFIKVNNLAANNLPDGESITVFAIAKNSDGDMLYFKQNYIVSNLLVIPLVMTVSSTQDILSMMESL